MFTRKRLILFDTYNASVVSKITSSYSLWFLSVVEFHVHIQQYLNCILCTSEFSYSTGNMNALDDETRIHWMQKREYTGCRNGNTLDAETGIRWMLKREYDGCWKGNTLDAETGIHWMLKRKYAGCWNGNTMDPETGIRWMQKWEYTECWNGNILDAETKHLKNSCI